MKKNLMLVTSDDTIVLEEERNMEFEPEYIIHDMEVYAWMYSTDNHVMYVWAGSSILID